MYTYIKGVFIIRYHRSSGVDRKQRRNFSLRPGSIKKLDKLAKFTGLSKSDVLDVLIHYICDYENFKVFIKDPFVERLLTEVQDRCKGYIELAKTENKEV